MTAVYPPTYAPGVLDLWTLAAVAVGFLTAGAALGWSMATIGVVGGLRSLLTNLNAQQQQIDLLADRIQREVKTRAGVAGAAKRTDKQLLDEAAEVATEPEGRPTTVTRRPTLIR